MSDRSGIDEGVAPDSATDPDPSGSAWWADAEYLATVAGVLSTGALFFYSGLVEGAPSPDTIAFVLLWIVGPWVVVYELARRFL